MVGFSLTLSVNCRKKRVNKTSMIELQSSYHEFENASVLVISFALVVATLLDRLQKLNDNGLHNQLIHELSISISFDFLCTTEQMLCVLVTIALQWIGRYLMCISLKAASVFR